MKKFNEWMDDQEPNSELTRKGAMGSLQKVDSKYRSLFRRFLNSLPESIDPSQRPHLMVALILELGYQDVNEAFQEIRSSLRKGVRRQKIDTPLMPPQDDGMANTTSGTNLG